jgi:two-component system sensor kinase FixL
MPHVFDKAHPNEADSIESHRLSAVLQMVTGLAHESRNALQRAQSCLELLELGTSDADEQHQLIDSIRRALTDLNQTYERVKAYASPITLTRSTVDLRQLCQTVFDELTESLNDCGASLTFIDGNHCCKALLDPTQMRIVLRHLIENALETSGSKTAIEVRCDEVTLRGQAAIEVRIRDHGSGFDSSLENKLFEPFITTKQRGEGLGLAVCRRIIEAHGGEISAGNHPEGGVEVRMVLPKQ